MDKYLKTVDTEWYKQRIAGVIICVLAAFVVIFIRLIYLQVIRGNEFRRLSLNNSNPAAKYRSSPGTALRPQPQSPG